MKLSHSHILIRITESLDIILLNKDDWPDCSGAFGDLGVLHSYM